MPTYKVQGPSGKTYTIDGPEGATADQLGQFILSQSHDERVAADTAKMRQEYAPTVGMGAGERFLAGAGAGMARVGRAIGQLNPFGGPTQADVEAARQTDAPLMNTTAGKVGSVAGSAALLAPTMFIPGVNTYAGAAGVGAATGALTTEGDLKDRAEGAVGGAIGGVAGKAIGDVVGAGARAVKSVVTKKLAERQAANATKDAAVAAANDAGYVVTPAMSSQPGVLGSVAEALGGKVKTQQLASVRNQANTNALIRQDLGMAADEPITLNALDAIRKDAGKAYADVAKMGKFDAAGADLPAAANVVTDTNKLTLGRQTRVDAKDLVEAWKQANHDATAYFRAYGRDANPETLAKAQEAAQASKKIDAFLTDALEKSGNSEAANALKAARVKIAKTYTAENALNESTGDIVGNKLAQQLAKGKKLSGGTEQAARFAQAFPKAAQSGVSVPNFSVLDAGMGAFGVGSGNVPAMLLPLARPGARSLALSPVVQNRLAAPNYQVNPLLERGANALVDPRVNALEELLGRSVGIDASQKKALER